jgi:hypothetical protein
MMCQWLRHKEILRKNIKGEHNDEDMRTYPLVSKLVKIYIPT